MIMMTMIILNYTNYESKCDLSAYIVIQTAATGSAKSIQVG